MENITEWFTNFRNSDTYRNFKKNPIAYFSAEYALSDEIPSYAGGLGVLAADYVKEAADQKLPFVAVGLYYHERYVGKKLDAKEKTSNNPGSPEALGLTILMDKNQKPVMIHIPIQDHGVFAKVWVWRVRGIQIYLLDTNLLENTPSDQKITNQLYVSDKEIRLKQAIILGIGGFRLLEALGISPSIYHMNEGHSALLALEVIRSVMRKRNINYLEAKEFTKEKIVFTNHTLVVAGQEVFSNDLIALLLDSYVSRELEVPLSEIIADGLVEESSMFSMTMFALRMTDKINAVSQLHSRKAAMIWTHHPMRAITNGIHLPTWDRVNEKINMREKHRENKKLLIEKVNLKTKQNWNENDLILGWARRMVRYKRPLALVGDLERFVAIAKKKNQPVRVVFAGVSHPGDDEGVELLEALKAMIEGDLKGIAVYLPSYGIELAKLLISGCDIWLNTPAVGFEACGTSGMKAALNGVLPCSTIDGWIDEVDLANIGWTLDANHIHRSVLDTLENQIVPLYYKNHKESSDNWLTYMQNARNLIIERFSATRMLKEYIEQMYTPCLS